MPTLHPQHRAHLERTVVTARRVAERGAGDVLIALGVEAERAPDHLSEEEKKQRVKLRAEKKRLGGFADLRAEVAYQTWHKLLFARFLLRSELLIYQGFAVVDEDLSDPETLELFGAANPAELEVALATAMLPGLFEAPDPSWNVTMPPETRVELRALLDGLPPEVFASDDALGWVYQYWQSARKAQVNAHAAGGNRIAAGDVSAVTQLFTEPYMVDWLLDQTLGQMDLPAQCEVRLLDPCCGSGHFLVAAFGRLHAARMEHLGEDEGAAAEGVLRDNLFGLELDPRCVQLAGFALLLAAWKRGGFRSLPLPHLACSGLAASGTLREWTDLAGDDGGLHNVLARLHPLFEQAPVLGSLLDPRAQLGYLNWEEVEPGLHRALERFGGDADPVEAIFGLGARGLVRAAAILAGQYDLVITNVPYLARGKHNPQLAEFCAKNYALSKSDLATVFLERGLKWLRPGGQIALVTPQNWLFLGSYARLRERLLRTVTWKSLAKLGIRGFSTPMFDFNIALFVIENSAPIEGTTFRGVDVSSHLTPATKTLALQETPFVDVSQEAQLRNPDARLTFEEAEAGELLEKYANGFAGVQTADYPMFGRYFWEIGELGDDWEFQQSTFNEKNDFVGRERIVYWQKWKGILRERHEQGQAYVRGRAAWGKEGVVVSSMGGLPVSIYTGELFDNNAATIVPKNPEHLPAIWCFCSSTKFNEAVRRIDQALKVTNASLVKVPFDLAHWTQVAAEKYPDGLPAPWSDDPTQWLFEGEVSVAARRGGDAALQVATARLLGYRWPAQRGARKGGASQNGGDGRFIGGNGRMQCAWTGATSGDDATHDGDDTRNAPRRGALHAPISTNNPVSHSINHSISTNNPVSLSTNHSKSTNHFDLVSTPQSDGNFDSNPNADFDPLDAFVDEDGIVCLPPCNGERDAASRLRDLLLEALPGQNGAVENLLDGAGWGGKTLDDWLRNGFWRAHCRTFGNRPFVWHIWDGHPQGFAALVNYHTLDRLRLDKLIHTYLGSYIRALEPQAQDEIAGAAQKLGAARALKEKLELIARGEAPHDIYVRWKPLAAQPIGWEPDLNDGVRLNIRPFVDAGVLRSTFTVGWNKDRGKNPDGSERLNDVHLTLEEKRRARSSTTT